MTTQAQQIEIFEPAMMEVEYNKKMVRDTLNRENDFISEAVRLRIGKKTVGIYNYSEYDWLITDRIRYLKTWYKANNTNMGAKVSQMYNLDLKAAKGTPQKMKHRNYDLEERDYQD